MNEFSRTQVALGLVIAPVAVPLWALLCGVCAAIESLTNDARNLPAAVRHVFTGK